MKIDSMSATREHAVALPGDSDRPTRSRVERLPVGPPSDGEDEFPGWRFRRSSRQEKGPASRGHGAPLRWHLAGILATHGRAIAPKSTGRDRSPAARSRPPASQRVARRSPLPCAGHCRIWTHSARRISLTDEPATGEPHHGAESPLPSTQRPCFDPSSTATVSTPTPRPSAMDRMSATAASSA